MAKKKKRKSNKNPFNQYGIWTGEYSAIKGAIRQAFRFAPHTKLVLEKARVEIPKFNKNGTMAKKPSVFYRCACCQNLFKAPEVQVDHIIPVASPTGEKHDYNALARSVFCSLDNLQVLCKDICHTAKTKAEREARKLLK